MRRDLSKTQPIRAWFAWFIALTIAFGLLVGSFVVGQNEVAVAITYTLLFIFGAFAIVLSYRTARSIDTETKLASKQLESLEKKRNIDDFLKYDDTESFFKNHVISLYKIAQSGNEVNQDNLIEILVSRLQAQNRVVSLYGNLLTTLGLIGTMVGLIIMMNMMVVTLQSNTGNVMKDLMSEGGAMAGLGAAFYTTLIGSIIGGVIIRLLSHFTESTITEYCSYIAEITEVNILPNMRSLSQYVKSANRDS